MAMVQRADAWSVVTILLVHVCYAMHTYTNVWKETGVCTIHFMYNLFTYFCTPIDHVAPYVLSHSLSFSLILYVIPCDISLNIAMIFFRFLLFLDNCAHLTRLPHQYHRWSVQTNYIFAQNFTSIKITCIVNRFNWKSSGQKCQNS